MRDKEPMSAKQRAAIIVGTLQNAAPESVTEDRLHMACGRRPTDSEIGSVCLWLKDEGKVERAGWCEWRWIA